MTHQEILDWLAKLILSTRPVHFHTANDDTLLELAIKFRVLQRLIDFTEQGTIIGVQYPLAFFPNDIKLVEMNTPLHWFADKILYEKDETLDRLMTNANNVLLNISACLN